MDALKTSRATLRVLHIASASSLLRIFSLRILSISKSCWAFTFFNMWDRTADMWDMWQLATFATTRWGLSMQVLPDPLTALTRADVWRFSMPSNCTNPLWCLWEFPFCLHTPIWQQHTAPASAQLGTTWNKLERMKSVNAAKISEGANRQVHRKNWGKEERKRWCRSHQVTKPLSRSKRQTSAMMKAMKAMKAMTVWGRVWSVPFFPFRGTVKDKKFRNRRQRYLFAASFRCSADMAFFFSKASDLLQIVAGDLRSLSRPRNINQ